MSDAKSNSLKPEKIRYSKMRKKMNLNNTIITFSAIGLFVIKYFIEAESITTILSTTFIIMFFGGIIASFTIRCEFCGTGWFNFPKGIGNNSAHRFKAIGKQRNTRYDPLNIPEKCPTCDAVFE